MKYRCTYCGRNMDNRGLIYGCTERKYHFCIPVRHRPVWKWVKRHLLWRFFKRERRARSFRQLADSLDKLAEAAKRGAEAGKEFKEATGVRCGGSGFVIPDPYQQIGECCPGCEDCQPDEHGT